MSALPFSGPTVEILTKTSVFFPIPFRNFAEVIEEISCVTVKVPKAPAALAWTTRSGIRSLAKCARVSISCVSCSRSRPPPPDRLMRRAVAGSPIGLPSARVYVGVESEFNYIEINHISLCFYRACVE